MDFIQLIILAIVQGITEFLPVSSSGHLVAVNELLIELGHSELQDQLMVNVMLHAGTLGSILVFYRREIVRILTTNRQLIGPIIVGTIPVGLLGVTIKKLLPAETEAWVESSILTSPTVSGAMFLVTAGLLIFSARRQPGETELPEIGYRDALLIGAVQSLAVLPGLSRSGSTIAAGLLFGLNRHAAATFSFLLAIPAIGGATLVEVLELVGGDASTAASSGMSGLAVATLVAFVVGIVSLLLLVKLVLAGKLQYFAIYLVPLGLVMLAWKGLELFG